MPRKKSREQLQHELETSRQRTKKIETELKDLERREAERRREEHRDACARVAERLCGSIGLTPEAVEADGLENYIVVSASRGTSPDNRGVDVAGSGDRPTLGL